jgi:hypothetical protein
MNFGSRLKGLLLVSGSEKCQNSEILGLGDSLGLDAESVSSANSFAHTATSVAIQIKGFLRIQVVEHMDSRNSNTFTSAGNRE